jgi:hypothetical protein
MINYNKKTLVYEGSLVTETNYPDDASTEKNHFELVNLPSVLTDHFISNYNLNKKHEGN